MARKHYYKFRYEANMLNMKSRGFYRAHFWYMVEYVNQIL